MKDTHTLTCTSIRADTHTTYLLCTGTQSQPVPNSLYWIQPDPPPPSPWWSNSRQYYKNMHTHHDHINTVNTACHSIHYQLHSYRCTKFTYWDLILFKSLSDLCIFKYYKTSYNLNMSRIIYYMYTDFCKTKHMVCNLNINLFSVNGSANVNVNKQCLKEA